MKIRNGFVSNSSSSSFILRTCDLSPNQIEAIKNHMDEWRKIKDIDVKSSIYGSWLLPDDDFDNILVGGSQIHDWDEWRVEEDRDILKLSTSMDNFAMGAFLKYIEVPVKAIIHQGD